MDVNDFALSLHWRDFYHSCSSDDDNDRDDSDDTSSCTSATSSSSNNPSSTSQLTPALSAMSIHHNHHHQQQQQQQQQQQHNDVVPAARFAPRGYQLELYQRALKENIIICVETGAGKTFISGLLINHILQQPAPLSDTNGQPQSDHQQQIEKSDKNEGVEAEHCANDQQPQRSQNSKAPIVVFLVHRVSLVQQQAQNIQTFLSQDFRVGCYHGDRGVDNWSPERWADNIAAHSVLVMTAQVFLNLLRHALIRMDELALLVVDEAHHATKSHPYRRVFLEFYHSLRDSDHRPRVFGMTATPVKAKNASAKHANCLSAISMLEATMDSTVVTVSVDGQSEVETLVPKPDEFVVSYAPSPNEDDDIENYTQVEDKVDKTILLNVLNNITPPQSESVRSADDSILGNNNDLLPESEMKVLARINNRIGYIAAKDIAERFCAQREMKPEPILQSLLKQCDQLDVSHIALRDKTLRLLDVLYFEFLRCRNNAANIQANQSDSSGGIDVDNGDRNGEDDSDKDSDKFRTIVFTHERISALALSNMINIIFAGHNCSELTARPVVGTAGQAAGLTLLRMSQSSMNATLDAFRAGDFGVLVATNVVEEGIDIPACRLVVTFDPPLSPAAYVQSRGRARKRGARYVTLVAAGVEADYYTLLRSREGARVMTDVSRGAYVTEDQRREMREIYLQKAEAEGLPREIMLYSKTTTAKVTATEAVNLLSRYCSVKGQVMCVEDITEPRYEVIPDRKMFKATVVLDNRFPIDGGFCNDPQLSAQVAKRHAALDAYKKLYEIGEVNEYLLPNKGMRSQRVLEVNAEPIGPVRSRRKRRGGNEEDESGQKKSYKKKSRLPVESKASKKHKRMRTCEISHPLVCQSTPTLNLIDSSSATRTREEGLDGDGVLSNGNGTDMETENEQDSRDSDMDPDIVNMETNKMTDIFLSEKGTRADVAKAVPMDKRKGQRQMFVYRIEMMKELDAEQWSSRNSSSIFGLVLKHRIRTEDLNACQCPSGSPLLMLSECGEVCWDDSRDDRAYRYVRAIQVCLMGKTPGSDRALEMEDLYRSGDYAMPMFYLLPLRYDETNGKIEIDWHSVDNLLSFGWRCGPLRENEVLSPEDMAHVLVCSSHERMERVYISDKLSDRLTADSSSDGYIARTYATFREYYESKHNVVVTDSQQALLPGYSLRETLSKCTNNVFMLVPEFVRVVPLDPIACYIASELLFWQTFMALRECWNRNGVRPIRFLEFARALQPNVNNVCNGNADLCYERSEFLGDSVLKVINSLAKYVLNPDGDEGDLSDARDIEVSNGHLADIAMRMKLHDCVAYSGIAPKIKSWPWYWGGFERKPLNVSEKVLADCLEALIGVHYQSGGFITACIFMERYGLLPGACKTLGIKVNDMGCGEESSGGVADAHDNGGVKIPIPRLDPNDERHESERIALVEQKIGYTFREKRHLVVALTHGSWNHGRCISYQKYEYLGDAVVGFILLSHFHDMYTHLGPNELTKLRGPALSNNLFARVIVGLGIHKEFWYDSVTMRRDIDEAASAILNEEDDEEDVCATIKVPKVLGDLLEAILGAIVVDQGMRMEVARTVSLQLLHDELERFANPNRFKHNVVSQLLVEVQKMYHTSPDFKFLDEPDDQVKTCEVWMDSRKLGSGVGPTRAIARRIATAEALKAMDADTGRTVLGSGGACWSGKSIDDGEGIEDDGGKKKGLEDTHRLSDNGLGNEITSETSSE